MKRTCKLCLSSLCFLICFLLSMSGIRARDEALAADIADDAFSVVAENHPDLGFTK